jgi:hemolysin D
MNNKNGNKTDQPITLVTPFLAKIDVNGNNSNGNGHKSNGNGNNSNGQGLNSYDNGKFKQPVILKQSRNWSRAILWTIIAVTTFGVIWACIAKIEEAVPAQGKLEPQDAVKEVKAPINGVVKEILVKDGQRVKQGDKLLRLDPEVAQSNLDSLNKNREIITKENQFYRSVINNSTSPTIPVQLPAEIASLTQSRKALLDEIQLYKTQLSGDFQGSNLRPDQRIRLQIATAELNSRVNANKLEIEQLGRQFEQNKVQLANAKSRLDVEQDIVNRIESVAREGGIAKIPYLKQQQEAKTRQAEVDQLIQEQGRLQLKIAQGQQQLNNTIAASQKDLTTLIANNEKQIAEIDSQLNKIIVENEKKIVEIDNQLKQTTVNLNYQELTAPVGGTIFELKASAPGYVTNPSEAVLKIVPEDALVAKVYITNKDIGFVREKMPVDIRIDSFPFSEYGDVKGELIWIGSDSLPPDQIRPYYTFPAKVKLQKQSLEVRGKTVPLQSGMSISANIRVRDRTVMSIFTDLFNSTTDSLKNVR